MIVSPLPLQVDKFVTVQRLIQLWRFWCIQNYQLGPHHCRFNLMEFPQLFTNSLFDGVIICEPRCVITLQTLNLPHLVTCPTNSAHLLYVKLLRMLPDENVENHLIFKVNN